MLRALAIERGIGNVGPLLTERFRGWEDRVTYWHVDDIDLASPVTALSEIDRHVDELIQRLGRSHLSQIR